MTLAGYALDVSGVGFAFGSGFERFSEKPMLKTCFKLLSAAVLPFVVLRSCMFMVLTQSGS